MLEILIGTISGIISGIGMGGGTILIFLLTTFGEMEQHVAQATNLLYFIPTAISAIIVNYKDKLVYQTKKNQCIRDIVLNHENNDIALVVGKYADDSETQRLQVVFLEKRGNKYIKVKSQKIKPREVDSIRWKGDEKVIVIQNGKREIITKQH